MKSLVILLLISQSAFSDSAGEFLKQTIKASREFGKDCGLVGIQGETANSYAIRFDTEKGPVIFDVTEKNSNFVFKKSADTIEILFESTVEDSIGFDGQPMPVYTTKRLVALVDAKTNKLTYLRYRNNPFGFFNTTTVLCK